MSRNIKEIGKELLGKSLNSFHRKTGLTQLEENNKMQDGILDGILSQVDDAYIEKTEQSNVIHLDGSGDGVVVLDSIEGNTLVNLATIKSVTLSDSGSKVISNLKFKQNTKYTLIFDVDSNTVTDESHEGIYLWFTADATVSSMVSALDLKGKKRYVITRSDKVDGWGIGCRNTLSGTVTLNNILILEGDWTDKEIPPYFEGLQSSFEDKVNNEGKYEIEILSNNGNIFDINAPIEPYIGSSCKVENESITVSCDSLGWYRSTMTLNGLKPNTTYYLKYEYESISGSPYKDVNIHDANGYKEGSNANVLSLTNGTFTTPNGCRSIKIRFYCGSNTTFGTIKYKNIMISENDMNYIPRKHNKIKLLINEPLRKITSDIKDRLCIKDGKLVVERKCKQVKFDGTIGIHSNKYDEINQIQIIIVYPSSIISDKKNNSVYTINSTLPCITVPSYGMRTVPNFSGYVDSSAKFVGAIPNKTGRSFTNKDVEDYFKENPMDVVYELEDSIYEEVLNEYGEPILLEGYENGTIYIDNTIVPTTTVRYTPKMESFKTLKEVENNNIMLTNDVNDNIIPYMMDVDLMIMEKEMALMSHKNIRKMEVLDMTSMQKRTQDMLERLIKGKTLTEQECKTRVTTYLHAGKITDEQAEELMLLIDEVYA